MGAYFKFLLDREELNREGLNREGLNREGLNRDRGLHGPVHHISFG